MTYRERIIEYKNGNLTEDERKKIESDIERQEAISDYLFEREEMFLRKDLPDFSEEWDNKEPGEERFVKLINRSVRRAFLKMGAATGAVILALILFVQYALPGIVSAFYYNPADKIAEETIQIELDLAVYTELTMPGYERDTVRVTDRGYGNYDICIYQNYSLNGDITNLNGNIEKGSLTLYDANLLRRPVGNVFGWFQMPTETGKTLEELVSEQLTDHGEYISHGHFFGAAGTKDQARETLLALPEDTQYVAYVTLNEMMDYETFIEYVESGAISQGQQPIWCAARVNDSGEGFFRPENLGFFYTPMHSSSLDWDREQYPALRLWDEAQSFSYQEELLGQEGYMRQHFVSMLRYMAAQEDFLALWGETPEVYREAAAYVEEYGIMVYGYVTIGKKEELVALADADGIYEIYVQELR